MINWLKTLWKDLGDLSKPQFFQKYVLPGLALFFTWELIGLIILINLDASSLVKNTGQVTDIAIKAADGIKRKNQYFPLRIGLFGYSEEFSLSDSYRVDFDNLQETILTGDTITIYTIPQWQSKLGWGKQIAICQIDKDKQTLFDFSKVIANEKSLATTFGVFCIILWPWYFIYRQTRKTD